MAVDKAPDGRASFFWAYDKWFGQAYGILGERNELQIETGLRSASQLAYLVDEESQIMLRPGETYGLTRRIIPGTSLLEVKAEAASLLGIPQELVRFHVSDESGEPVEAADIEVELNGHLHGWGRTDKEGAMGIQLPAGKAVARVSALARGSALIGAGSLPIPPPPSHPGRAGQSGGSDPGRARKRDCLQSSVFRPLRYSRSVLRPRYRRARGAQRLLQSGRELQSDPRARKLRCHRESRSGV